MTTYHLLLFSTGLEHYVLFFEDLNSVYSLGTKETNIDFHLYSCILNKMMFYIPLTLQFCLNNSLSLDLIGVIKYPFQT